MSLSYDSDLSERVIGCAIEVHRHLGPGLLESAYEQCIAHEMSSQQMSFKLHIAIPVRYKGMLLDCAYQADIVVHDSVIVELKSVDALVAIHDAQLLTYMKLSA